MTAARVGVVVVTYRSAEVVGTCVASLSSAVSSGPASLEAVVVVDNDSPDATVSVSEAALGALVDGWEGVAPRVSVVATGANLGYAAAINRGRLDLGDVDALLVLNPDTVLAPGAIDALVTAIRESGADVVVPLMTSPEGRPAFSLRRWPSLVTAAAEALLGGAVAGRLGWGEVVADTGAYDRAHDIAWATGAAVLVGRRALTELGDWDESFFLYSEETEYMERARARGLRVRFEPAARCAHRGGASGTSPQLWALLMTNKVRLYQRSHGTVATVAFRALLLVGQAVRGLRGSAEARAATRDLLRMPERAGLGD